MTDATETTHKKNILLVDDDRFLIDMYSMKFVQNGYTVQGCLSVREALSVLRGGFAADVVLFDLIMPEADGFAFLEALNAERLVPDAVRIALTNQSEDADRTHATSLGANRFVIKATTIPSEVVTIVSEELAHREKV